VSAFEGSPRFEIVRRLGVGGMGAVFEALDRERERHVALKVLTVENPDALLRFKREFRALQSVHHPNLVSLGELFAQGDTWFFTMELVRGVDLLAHIRAEPGDSDGRIRSASTRRGCARHSISSGSGWRRCIVTGTFIATSSRRTCWSPPTIASSSSTSAWCARPTTPPIRRPTSCSARPSTWRPSRRWAAS
jgi:hypothetical protein